MKDAFHENETFSTEEAIKGAELCILTTSVIIVHGNEKNTYGEKYVTLKRVRIYLETDPFIFDA